MVEDAPSVRESVLSHLDEESYTKCFTIDYYVTRCFTIDYYVTRDNLPYDSLGSMRRTDYRAPQVRAQNAVQKPNHISNA